MLFNIAFIIGLSIILGLAGYEFSDILADYIEKKRGKKK